MYNRQSLPLSPWKIVKKTIEKVWVFVIMLIWPISMLTYEPVDTHPQIFFFVWILVAVWSVLIFLVALYQYFYYRFYYYNFKDDDAEIKKGVVSRASGFVRYEKVQNIYVDQDFLDRAFGLYDVHYETAGEQSGFYSHVDGLNKINADKLAVFLNEKVGDLSNKKQKTKEIMNNSSQITTNPADKNQISSSTHPLSPKVIAKKTISITFGISLFVLTILAGVIGGSEGADLRFNPLTATIALIAIVAVGSYIYSRVWYKNFRFDFGIEKGEIFTKVIGQKTSYLYYDRIQNISVAQSIIGRFFSIYNIRIETAGEMSGAFLVLDGYDKESAESIKEFLMGKAKNYRSRL